MARCEDRRRCAGCTALRMIRPCRERDVGGRKARTRPLLIPTRTDMRLSQIPTREVTIKVEGVFGRALGTGPAQSQSSRALSAQSVDARPSAIPIPCCTVRDFSRSHALLLSCTTRRAQLRADQMSSQFKLTALSLPSFISSNSPLPLLCSWSTQLDQDTRQYDITKG